MNINTVASALRIGWKAAGNCNRDYEARQHHWLSIASEISGMQLLLIEALDENYTDALADDMHFLWCIARERAYMR